MKLDDVLFFGGRHGTTPGNAKGTYRSWSNGPDAQLNGQGRRDGEEAARFLQRIKAPIELIITDSLDRVVETAEIIKATFPNAQFEVVRALHPLDVGEWTGKSKEAHPVEPYLKDTAKKIPGGESLDEFNARQRQIYEVIFKLADDLPGGRIVVLGHGSNTSYLYNHEFQQDGRIGYEGLVDPGGLYAVTPKGLQAVFKARGKNSKAADGPGKPEGKKFSYPPDDELGVQVPKGGSSCASCEYLGADRLTCVQKDFIIWNDGSNVIPGKIDEYCSIWWKESK